MKKEILAIFDGETDYALRLMEYLNKKKGNPFEVHAFSSYESLVQFSEKHKIHVLLADQAYVTETEQLAEYVMFLSDGKRRVKGPIVYKYQSCDDIMGELLESYAECREEQGIYGRKKKVFRIIGVTSPVGRCGKTGFAIVAGQILGKEHPVLYLNLEACPGLERWLPGRGRRDLMDLMVFSDQREGDFALRLQAAVMTQGQLDYLGAAQYPHDLKHVEPEEWKQLFRNIRDETIYETLIMDIGAQMPVELLDLCTQIYMPYVETEVHKINQFYHILQILDKDYLRERIVPIVIPYYPEEKEPEQMRWGKTGRFIQSLLWKD